MVSPQNNPNPTVGENVATTGRGFVSPEERAAAVYQPQALSTRSRVSWGAVIAGSLLTTSLLVLSSSLAYACGVPAFSGGAYGFGAGLWSVITAAIAFYAGGCVAAYLTGPSDLPYSHLLHGAMAWALTIPLVMILFSGGQGLFGQGGVLGTNVARIIISGTPLGIGSPAMSIASTAGEMQGLHTTGAAWGALISLVVGLVAAAAGGHSMMGGMTGGMTGRRT